MLGILLIYNQGLGNELNNKGLLSGILSGILFAFVIISTKILSKYYSSITIVGMHIIISALVLSPFLMVEQKMIIDNIILLLVLGLIHTALAEFLYIDGLVKISAQKAATISYIEPASAIIYAIILLNSSWIRNNRNWINWISKHNIKCKKHRYIENQKKIARSGFELSATFEIFKCRHRSAGISINL